MASEKTKRQIIDAFMALVAENGFHRTGLADIAVEAKVPLATLRDAYNGKVAIFADFLRRIDLVVLEGESADSESARDRLFEVLMRRFDALHSYRPALKRIAGAARRDLCLARVLHRLSARSQKWMLAAANIKHGGPVGVLVIEGTVLAFLDAFRVWLDDEDPGLAATMAALDKALRRGERALKLIDDACACIPRVRCRPRRERDGETVEAMG
jgi:AcrR family transcriptional regulator